MRRAGLVLALCCLVALASGCAPSLSNTGLPILPKAVSETLARGVFEVVVPAVQDTPGTRYAVPLPFDLLPYTVRTDRFQSIATAFAISRTRFVTAAHVMPLRSKISDAYFVRDASGRTYPIGQITRYSQYRDLVEFELASPAADVEPLVTREDIAVGEAVFTVGNAYASGIVSRGGALVSFTPEPAAGAWKNLRFTSPNSPGNSGGPLVDSEGRVVGVAVASTPAETLNVAVPIRELDSVSTKRCDAGFRGLTFDEDRHEFLADWTFTAPLPDSIGSLQTAARRSFDEFYRAKAAEFDARFAQDTFPNAPRLRGLLQHPTVGTGFGGFEVDGTGEWRVVWSTYKSKEISPGWFVESLDSADGKSGQILLNHPPDVPLARFFETPRLLAEVLVRQHDWAITFAGQRIRIEALGEPSRSERWRDEYGRPWFTFAWSIPRAHETLQVNCLTNPAGWGCGWSKLPEQIDDIGVTHTKRLARRLTFSYFGFLDDWNQFLALPDTFKPQLFAGASIRIDGAMTFAVPPFAGNIVLKPLSGRSLLDAFVVPSPANPKQLAVLMLTLRPIPTVKSLTLSTTRVVNPLHVSSSMDQVWRNMIAGAAPFDDVERVEGDTRTIQQTKSDGSQNADAPRLLVTCHSRTGDKDIDLRSMCTAFETAVRLAPPGGD
jgi:hypothetical protein